MTDGKQYCAISDAIHSGSLFAINTHAIGFKRTTKHFLSSE